jgi:RpiR family carbohydrate utilization transcriptional regulator
LDGLTALGLQPESTLRPSERKVTKALVDDPDWFSRATLSEIALRTGVSEPTVVRFARSLGFEGFQDLRYYLIGNLASPPSPIHSVIGEDDDLHSVVNKVFDGSIRALSDLRDTLDEKAVESAVDTLMNASDIIVLGFGASGIVGQDMAQKFPLFAKPVNAPIDAHQQFMAATLARESSAVVAISNTAATMEVRISAAEARRQGARVIAISGREGPLTEIADISIITGFSEDTNEFTPTSSRLAHLAVIDVLAIAVSLRSARQARDDLRAMKTRLSIMRASGQPIPPD